MINSSQLILILKLLIRLFVSYHYFFIRLFFSPTHSDSFLPKSRVGMMKTCRSCLFLEITHLKINTSEYYLQRRCRSDQFLAPSLYISLSNRHAILTELISLDFAPLLSWLINSFINLSVTHTLFLLILYFNF